MSTDTEYLDEITELDVMDTEMTVSGAQGDTVHKIENVTSIQNISNTNIRWSQVEFSVTNKGGILSYLSERVFQTPITMYVRGNGISSTTISMHLKGVV